MKNEKYTYLTDLADMQLISKYNKGFRLLLCAIDIFIKYACFAFLSKIKKGITVTNTFQKKFFDGSSHKLNKIWVGKGSEFYSRPIKSWLQNNGIEMHSTHNKGKSLVTERFIRTLKNKINKYITSILKRCVHW